MSLRQPSACRACGHPREQCASARGLRWLPCRPCRKARKQKYRERVKNNRKGRREPRRAPYIPPAPHVLLLIEEARPRYEQLCRADSLALPTPHRATA